MALKCVLNNYLFLIFIIFDIYYIYVMYIYFIFIIIDLYITKQLGILLALSILLHF